MRKIAGYLTKKKGGHDQKDTQGIGGNYGNNTVSI